MSPFSPVSVPGAEVTNLTLDGSVTGRNYVSALAAESEASLSADVSAVTVKGENFVAASVASGAGRDARVIEFGTVPAAVNITMGSDSAAESLGLVTKGATVTFDPGATGTSWSYDDASGNFTVTKEADFSGGDVTFSVSLGDRVTSTVHTIAVSSKNMYESGSGIEGDPYVVIDADQFTATLHTYPAAHVKLTEDIAVSDWETIPAFSGSLDGGGHTVEGLTGAFRCDAYGCGEEREVLRCEYLCRKERLRSRGQPARRTCRRSGRDGYAVGGIGCIVSRYGLRSHCRTGAGFVRHQ